MKKIRHLLKKRDGTTLVETIVTLLLICIMMAMAASALSSAAKIFVREQNMQYAQSILDTTLSEIRGLTKNANGYIKIYGQSDDTSGSIADMSGINSGNILEFMNNDGYAVLVSADGCNVTELLIGNQEQGQSDAVESGQLLTRYYFYNNGSYAYSVDGVPTARAVTTVFGKGFYMGNFLDVEWTFPDGIQNGDSVEQITVTATLYSDQEKTKALATDTEVLQFRHPLVRKDAVTAVAE